MLPLHEPTAVERSATGDVAHRDCTDGCALGVGEHLKCSLQPANGAVGREQRRRLAPAEADGERAENRRAGNTAQRAPRRGVRVFKGDLLQLVDHLAALEHRSAARARSDRACPLVANPEHRCHRRWQRDRRAHLSGDRSARTHRQPGGLHGVAPDAGAPVLDLLQPQRIRLGQQRTARVGRWVTVPPRRAFLKLTVPQERAGGGAVALVWVFDVADRPRAVKVAPFRAVGPALQVQRARACPDLHAALRRLRRAAPGHADPLDKGCALGRHRQRREHGLRLCWHSGGDALHVDDQVKLLERVWRAFPCRGRGNGFLGKVRGTTRWIVHAAHATEAPAVGGMALTAGDACLRAFAGPQRRIPPGRHAYDLRFACAGDGARGRAEFDHVLRVERTVGEPVAGDGHSLPPPHGSEIWRGMRVRCNGRHVAEPRRICAF